MSGNKVEIKVEASVSGQPALEKLEDNLKGIAPAAQKTAQAGAAAGQGMESMAAGAAKADVNLGATRRGLASISAQLAETQRGIATLRDSLLSGWSFKQFVDAAAQMEQVQAGLKAVAGSSTLAGQQLEFVRSVASRTGVDVLDAGKAFLGLSAATKGTAVEGEPTRRVFEAVATAMAKAGKSSAETQNALLALSQMASKGTVAMEELRGQLGEALPGALQAVSNGFGITTQDLIKLVESGQVAAQDLFPALAAGLNGIYGTAPAAQTLSQEITNIKNSFVDMASHIGEAGALDALKAGAEVAQTAIVYLDDSLIQIGKSIGVMMAAIATMDFSGLKQAFADIEAESRTKLLKAAEHNTVLAASIRAGGTEAAKAGLAAQEQAKAVTTAAAAAVAAAPQYIALANAYTKVREEIKGQVDLAGKNLAAREKENAAMVAQAQLYGTEAQIRQAAVQGAQLQYQAAQRLAELRTTEVNVMRAELEAKKAQLALDGPISEQRKKELKELQDLIDLHQAEADKAVAQANASRILAEQTALEVEKHKDNSARLRELADAYEQARQKLEQLQRLKEQGKATTEQVAQAEKEAAKASALYRDALGDIVTKLQARQVAERAAAQVAEITLNAEKASLKAIEEAARANGDYATALAANIEQKKIDIKIIEAKVQAMKAEADGNIAVAKAELAVLQASGNVDPVKRAQIEASIKLAEAKKVEAEAIALAIDPIAREIQALQNGTKTLDGFGDAAGNAADKQRGLNAAIDAGTLALERENAALERKISAQEKANDLKQREIDLENKRLNRDSEGFSVGPDGKRIVLRSDRLSDRGVYERAKSQGLTDEQALSLIGHYGTSATANKDNAAVAPIYAAMEEAINRMVLENAQKRVQDEKKKEAEQKAQQQRDEDARRQKEQDDERKAKQQKEQAERDAAQKAAQQPQQPAPQPQPRPPAQASETANVKSSTNVTINVAAGVDVSSRGQAESIARAIMPAIKDLSRRGFGAS